MGQRIYNVTEIAGELPLYDDQYKITPRLMYYVGLVEMRQQDWGWAPAIISYETENEADLKTRRQEIMDELERILTVHYL